MDQLKRVKKISIFASGSGSNAQKIYEYFNQIDDVTIDTLVVSKATAGVIEKSKNWGCEVIILNKKDFYQTEEITNYLKSRNTDLIVLAGFLWLISQSLLKAFPNKIINIHPALLPKFGGKGMYGMHVHNAVYDAKEKKSGITIHTINEEYDKGEVLFQKECEIEGLLPEEIAKKVLSLEHENFAKVIHKVLQSNS